MPHISSSHVKSLCLWDPDTFPVRFYHINVKATDFAGNVDNATATVIVLPLDYSQSEIFVGDPNFNSNTFFIDMVKKSLPENIIFTMETVLEVRQDHLSWGS